MVNENPHTGRCQQRYPHTHSSRQANKMAEQHTQAQAQSNEGNKIKFN